MGYLLAGVAVGPFTPGFVGDQALAQELAELGVVLLMFGVGLHFSLTDLLSVRAIAVPGAVAQIAVATLLGLALARALGWSTPGGVVFGLSLSVASTVVLLRAVQERRLIETEPLGAFFAGMVLNESELSHEAAEESLPLRDASRCCSSYRWGCSASLAQIGEFSFILAGLGVKLHLLPEQGRDLILAGAILSIVMNPLIFAAIDRVPLRPRRVRPGGEPRR